jgi:hypothetical protein
MKQYAYCMIGDAPDPIGSGDTKSWFLHYKWRLDEKDEVFLPVPKDTFPDIEEGDDLWFLMDEEILGHAPVLRVCMDWANERKEIWFDTSTCVAARSGMTVDDLCQCACTFASPYPVECLLLEDVSAGF